MFILKLIAVIAVSYALGSVSCAIIASKLLGKGDVRSSGSGNAGLTNAYRTGGAAVAALTLLGDTLKGVSATLLGGLIMSGESVPSAVRWGMYTAALAVLLGHIYPVYFGFRGGKGVLTSAAVLAVLNYKAFLVVLAVFIIMFAATRIVSVSSISAAVFLPLTSWLLPDKDFRYGVLFFAVLSVIIIIKHKDNINRLLRRQESRISFKKAEKEENK